MNFAKNPIIKNIVLISGLTRSGKALLCPIVSSLNNTEKVNVNFFLEQVPILNYLREINNNTSKFLIRSGMNMGVYDNAIGRNSNFRPDDYTSVWKYKEPMEYVQRLFLPDGDAVLDRLNQQNRVFPMMVHNGLWHANLWFDALPSLKMIHMQRSPIEIVFSWMGKGYGGGFYTSGRSNIVTYEYKGKVLPYYAYGWEELYVSLGDVDRIIYMVQHIRECHQKSYESLDVKQKDRVLFVRHRGVSTNPDKHIPIISDFVGESPSNRTSDILLQENCPRVFNSSEFDKKVLEIQQQSSTEAFDILMGMHHQFISHDCAI